MTDSSKYCVILAGGAGSRIWPISRVSFPKQFLEVSGTGKTFLELTYERFCTIVPPENILIVTASRYQSLVKDILPEVPDRNILLEPYARNTAPATAYAAYTILKRDPDATVVVTPCDHIIFGESEFRSSILSAMDFVSANDDVILTLGVVPTRPDTNFGYIQAVGGRNAYEKGEPLPVKTFTEKPDLELAKVFVDSGEFLWNSGLIVWKATAIEKEFREHTPQLATWFEGWDAAIGTENERAFLERAYGGCEKQAIDFGLMEKTSSAWVYPANFGWADIGVWDSLYDYVEKVDDNGNAVVAGDNIMSESHDNLVVTGNKGKLVAIRGLDNFLVVDTDDVLVICPRDGKNYNDLVTGLSRTGLDKYR